MCVRVYVQTVHIYFSVELIRLILAHCPTLHIGDHLPSIIKFNPALGISTTVKTVSCARVISVVTVVELSQLCTARRALRNSDPYDCCSAKLVSDNSELALILASMIENRLTSNEALPKSFKVGWLWNTGCHDLCLMIEIHHFRWM